MAKPDNGRGGRKLKKIILDILGRDLFANGLEEISRMPPRQAVNPLLSCFYHSDARIRWRAITATGAVVSRLAGNDLESARVVMRRLLWSLNEESGGIGWGAPEALGEIMARQAVLAGEFSDILISYIRPEANYIEFEALQRGVLWGLGRLAQVRPRLLRDVPRLLRPYLKANDPVLRGLAAWTAGLIGSAAVDDLLEKMADDDEKLQVFINGSFEKRTVGQLARKALARIRGGDPDFSD